MKEKAIITITDNGEDVDVKIKFDPEMVKGKPSRAANVALKMLAAVATPEAVENMTVKGKK